MSQETSQGQVSAPSQETQSQVSESESESSESSESSEVEAQSGAEAQAEAAQDVLDDPKASKKEKEAAKKMLKKLKIKFNGREIEEELPFEIPDDENAKQYMTKQLQLSKLAQVKAQEEAELRRSVDEFFKDFKKNPRAVLEDPNLGIDLKKLVADYIEEEIQNSSKTPEQLEKEKLEKELKSLKEEREREKKELEAREAQRLEEHYLQQYDAMLSKALSQAGIPKSAYVVKKIADYMAMGLEAGRDDITPEDVLPMVMDEIQEEIKEMMGVSPDDFVEKILGKDRINSYRKKTIQKAKSKTPPSIAQVKDVGTKSEAKPSKEAEKISFKKFFGI